MAIELIKGLGEGGLNADLPAVVAPMNVFTDVLNVRFDNSAVQTITGEALFWNNALAPTFGIFWKRPDQGYTIFAKDGLIYRVDAAGNAGLMFNDGGYINTIWQGTTFNGGFAVVLNDGVHTPIYALYGDPVAGSTFQPLPNWNYVSGLTVTAKVIRSLNYSLVAANLTLVQGGITTYAPGTIRVSVQAATGQIPTIWQPGLTTDTADEFELSSTSQVLDMAELRGNMYIYSEDCIHVLTIGAQTVVRPYAKGYGILNTNCVTEFDGKHFVVDRNDIYIHGGSGGIESISNFRVRDWFFSNLNKTYSHLVHVTVDRRNDEIWVNFPSGSSTKCDKSLIFQYRNNTFTVRSLPSITYSFQGFEKVAGTYRYSTERLLMATGTDNVFITDDNYLMWNGSSFTTYPWYIERKKMTIDVGSNTHISSVYPIFDKVPASADITVRVISQNNYKDDVDLSVDNSNRADTFAFLPDDQKSQGYKVDPRVTGRLLNYRITSTDYARMCAFGFEAQPAGRR